MVEPKVVALEVVSSILTSHSKLILDSQVVRHSTVNRKIVGSIPTPGARGCIREANRNVVFAHVMQVRFLSAPPKGRVLER